jgi:hypothetical protein
MDGVAERTPEDPFPGASSLLPFLLFAFSLLRWSLSDLSTPMQTPIFGVHSQLHPQSHILALRNFVMTCAIAFN